MLALGNFAFEGSPVRVLGIGGEPAWVAKDVCDSLSYAWNGSKSIAHVPDMWKGVESVSTPSGTQEMLYLTEQGLYFFLGRSDKPKALAMQMWLAGEVLPSIRRTGSYAVRAAVPAPRFEIPQTLPNALRLAADQCERAERAEARVVELEPKGEFVDRYVDAEGAKGVREVCQVLNANEKEFTHFLEKDACVMYRLGGCLAPMSTHRGSGRFVVKTGVSSGGRAYNQARFTPKGVRWIAGLWAQFLLDPQAFRERHAKVKRTDDSGPYEGRA
jgi:phage antirepressor YoqD-like protein